MPGRVDLGPQDALQPVGRQPLDDAVVQDTGRVHHGGQRVLRRYPGQHAGQRLAVGDVGRGHGDPGAEPGELGGHILRPRGGGAAPAHEQEVAYAVPGDQVAGEEGAEAARATGDQHGAVGGERGRRRVGRASLDGLV